jgi:hypothetical protein
MLKNPQNITHNTEFGPSAQLISLLKRAISGETLTKSEIKTLIDARLIEYGQEPPLVTLKGYNLLRNHQI